MKEQLNCDDEENNDPGGRAELTYEFHYEFMNVSHAVGHSLERILGQSPATPRAEGLSM